MANIDRLTKRVKKIEEWIDENGSGETLGNFNFLLDAYRGADGMAAQIRNEQEMLRSLLQEFLTGKKLMDEWNEFIKEKDDAVQKQQTEEIPLQEQAESSEEAIEAPKEEEG